MIIKRGKQGRKHQYELSFKRKVCQELLSGQITITDLARQYNISGAGTIMRWVKWFQQEQEELLSSQPMEISQENNDPNIEKSAKEMEVELRLAKAKIATLETMIDIAEQQFNIEIRKKSGTKPSSE
jgi:transposase-like protein